MITRLKLANKISHLENASLRILNRIRISKSRTELNRILKDIEFLGTKQNDTFKDSLSYDLYYDDSNKAALIESLNNLIYRRNYNYHLWQFVTNGISCLIPHINLCDCYKIVKTLLKAKCEDGIVNNRRIELLHKILSKIDSIVKYHNINNIVDITRHDFRNIPVDKGYDESCNISRGGVGGSNSTLDYELCYKLWYCMRGIDDVKVINTREIILSVLEHDKIHINGMDIMRIIRMLDVLFENKTLDKIQEKLASKLLKQLFYKFPSDANNNFSIIHIKKCFLILSQCTYTIPNRLNNILSAYSVGVANFLQIAFSVIKNSVKTHGRLFMNTSDATLLYKGCKLHCCILNDLVDFLKFADLYGNDTKDEIINIILELRRINFMNDSQCMLSISKSFYYLILSLGYDRLNDNRNFCNDLISLMESMHKIIINEQVELNHLKLLLYHDKILNLLKIVMPTTLDITPPIAKLSSGHTLFLSESNVTGTLLITLLNKHSCLDESILDDFLNSLNYSWSTWSNHELTMLFDLFGRIDQTNKVISIINSLYEHINVNSLNNDQLISFVKCIARFNNVNFINKRISSMNYKQLIKLLSLGIIDSDLLMTRLLSLKLDDITELVCLLRSRPELRDNIMALLDNIDEVNIVEDSYYHRLSFYKRRNKVIGYKFKTEAHTIVSTNAAKDLLIELDSNHKLYEKLKRSI